jgi:hypothetical protein
MPLDLSPEPARPSPIALAGGEAEIHIPDSRDEAE